MAGELETTVMWDQAVIEFDNGVACLFEKPPRAFPSTQQNFPVGWQVEGTKGHLDRNQLVLYGDSQTYTLQERYATRDGQPCWTWHRWRQIPPVAWENPHKQWRIGSADDIAKASILIGFHNAITQGGQPLYGYENALRDWELCLAIRESARRGNAWVDLPLGEPTALEQQIEAEFVRRYGHDPIEETDQLLDAAFTRSTTVWPYTHWL